MAKEKRSIEDLDAELAALEAELAALEGRKAAPRKAKPAPAKQEAPQPEPSPQPAPSPEPEPSHAPEAPRKNPFRLGGKKDKDKPKESPLPKPKLALPFGKKKTPAPAPEPPAAEALLEEGAPETPAIAQAPAMAIVDAPSEAPRHIVPVTDASLWRQEDGAWVRDVPATPVPVVRRILDERGEIVREEPATRDDVDEATGAKAERGLGKILGTRALKLPAFGGFGRKKE